MDNTTPEIKTMAVGSCVSESHGLGSLWISCSALKGWHTPQAMQMWLAPSTKKWFTIIWGDHFSIMTCSAWLQKYLEHGHVIIGQVPNTGVLVLLRQGRAVVGLQELLTRE